MPTGDNPNSRANLKPVRSKEEARTRGKAGGIKSGKSRRALGTWKAAYNRTMSDDDLEAILNKVREMARRGNLNALDRLIKISGEDTVTELDNDNVQAFLDALKDGKE